MDEFEPMFDGIDAEPTLQPFDGDYRNDPSFDDYVSDWMDYMDENADNF